jgi:hypothetical protein
LGKLRTRLAEQHGADELPFNKIHVPQALSSEMCKAINGALHDSLVATCGVNPSDDFCLVCRYADGDAILHPTFLGNRDPKGTIVVEIALLGGRSDEQKEALYKDLRKRFRGIGFDPANSIVFLLENRAIDWSFSEAGSVKTVLAL